MTPRKKPITFSLVWAKGAGKAIKKNKSYLSRRSRPRKTWEELELLTCKAFLKGRKLAKLFTFLQQMMNLTNPFKALLGLVQVLNKM
jgi:hypothetical protein